MDIARKVSNYHGVKHWGWRSISKVTFYKNICGKKQPLELILIALYRKIASSCGSFVWRKLPSRGNGDGSVMGEGILDHIYKATNIS